MYSALGRGAASSFRKKKRKNKERLTTSTLELPAGKGKDGDWEVDRSTLSDLTEIGSGQFGVVYIGTAQGLSSDGKPLKVAVKTLQSDDPSAKQDFLAEANVMKAIDGSRHIVRLLGVCTDTEPFYMIMEFIKRGDLKEVLRDARPKTGTPAPFGQRRLAQMGADVASGMAYLASMTVVHRDLAARNCMVTDDYTCKIGDFGLTRKTYSREYYRMTASCPLPIRWMAPECLNDGVFHTASDVWAFGIVLWEIATFGKLPYTKLENMDVAERIQEGDYRMPEPRGCPRGMYAIMLRCWEEEPEDRDAFDDISSALIELAATLSSEPITRAVFTGAEPGAAADAEEDSDEEDAGESGATDAAGYAVPAAESGGTDASGYSVPVAWGHNRPVSTAGAEELTLGVAEWIGSRLGRTLDPSDLHGELQSGVALCELANSIKTGVIRKFHTGKSATKAVKQMDNISRFLGAAYGLGVPQDSLFEVEDLHEDTDMARVVTTLDALRTAVSS